MRRTNRAEIHTHSTASDGLHEPSDVAHLLSERDVAIWSLTDHDNCNGCGEARRAAETLGITFIPGIEMSAWEERSVHVLGYGVDPAGTTMRHYADKRLEMRRARMEKMVGRCRELGLDVTFDEVVEQAGQGGLGRPHLARTLLENGEVDTIQHAFDDYIGTDGPAYVATKWPSVPRAIELIHEAGGIAVAAHPAKDGLVERLPDWTGSGLDGVEIIHPAHHPGQVDRISALAEELGLLRTASSDFHGLDHDSANYFGQVDFPDDWLDAFLAACRR